MTMRWLPVLCLVAACGAPAPAPESEAPAAEVSHEGHVASRVFFVQPRDGAVVKSPIMFEFGSEAFTIAAVPPAPAQGTPPAAPRAGMGHFHLGVDTDCLPAGTLIPRAEPWIHFGDGKAVIEMQMTPGPHRFSVQVGDDEHRTLEGLCETISVTVQAE